MKLEQLTKALSYIFPSIKKAENTKEPVTETDKPAIEKTSTKSLCAVKSDTEKSMNQDACGFYRDEATETTIVAVADGIGSNKHVEVGSRFVTDKVLELIASNLKEGSPIDYTAVFAKTQELLTSMVDCDYAEQLSTINPMDFGTTLIVGVDTPDTFALAYVGNGCAYHILGDFVKFPEVISLPWSVNNLLLPHSLPDEVTGQETLCKYFCYHPVNIDQCVPTVITVSKNHHAGEIFVIATDGVDSKDKHDAFGFDEDERELITTSSWSMSLLCERIKLFLEESTVFSDEELEEMLEKYMITLRNEDLMDDDVTLGMIMSPKVFQKTP